MVQCYSPLLIYVICLVLVSLIYRYEAKKYKRNNPYNSPKKKKRFFHRLKLGILAGIHYSHFVGTYNHKRYNTQVFTPKTFECYLGGSIAGLIIGVYLFLSFYLYLRIGIFGSLIIFIPIISNIISIIIDKKRRS